MASKGKQLVVEIAILISFVIALFGYYFNYKGRWILSLLCYLTSAFILTLPAMVYVGFKAIQYFMPFIMKSLTRLNQRLMPIANYVSHNKILGPLISIFVRGQFFMWFMVLMMSDHVIRIVMGRFAGQHASNQYLSLINVGDNRFFKSFHEELKASAKSDQQEQAFKLANSGKSNPDLKQLQYSLSVAHTLSVASKLAYEDVAVVKYELEKAGYDVQHTFKAIGYKNVCAYVIEKDNDILLVFRGTNPLNIQNYVTNVDAGLTKVSSSKCYMGKVHKGFWDAMGATEASESTSKPSKSEIHIDLSSASLYHSFAASVFGIVRIIKALSFNVFANVLDPIDASWAGHNSAIVRHQSMFSQAEQFILELFRDAAVTDAGKKKRFYITGHSLGGGLATVFLAKMIQKESPLLDYFEGLYTYGQPNIGDQDFSRAFGPNITCKIFNHVYNNDIVPRIPYWYSSPPGTLVFIDSSYKISIYPPNQRTQEPIPLRNISYLHLSGLLNKHVIMRLLSETPIRIMFRIMLPFFINDHFPSDYSDALLSADIRWFIVGEDEAGYDDAEEERYYQEKARNSSSSKRYSLQIGQEEEGAKSMH